MFARSSATSGRSGDSGKVRSKASTKARAARTSPFWYIDQAASNRASARRSESSGTEK